MNIDTVRLPRFFAANGSDSRNRQNVSATIGSNTFAESSNERYVVYMFRTQKFMSRIN